MRVMLTLVALAGACGFDPHGTGARDGAVAIDGPTTDDASVIDGPVAIDAAAVIDAAVIDAAVIDAAAIDAAAIDAPAIDAAAIDAPAIDAPAIDARPACPVTYNVVHNGRAYGFRPIALQHALATSDCEDDLPGRTHLATFEVAADLDPAIAAVNPGNNATPYVGAVCAAADCAVTTAWTWVTGAAVAATLWDTGQPNNGTTQQVARVERVSSTWVLNNVIATSTLPYICECDP